MKTRELLQEVELFKHLTKDELKQLADICKESELQEGDVFTTEGEEGHTLCIIKDGLMEVCVNTGSKPSPRVLLRLGRGQLIGEMSLVDRGTRSATVKAIQTPTKILVIQYEDFQRLCEENYRIGYVVMRNIAADLSFKLRHRSLTV